MKENKLELFLEKAKAKFPNFDYSKVAEFTNKEKDKVCIICPEHGEFVTSPRTFLASKYGCKKCANILKGINSRKVKNVTTAKNNLPEDLIPLENPITVDKSKLVGTVYCFINNVNNKLYIGETVKSSYNERITEHYSKSKTINNYFYKAIRKYGWNNFSVIILFQTEVMDNTDENKKILNDIVNEKEVYYINKYNTIDHTKGYNLTDGGDGVVNYKFSEESRSKMSEKRSGENHWNYGNFNNKTSSLILQFDLDFNFIREWPSMKEIERELKYKSNNISNCCNNKLDSYKGFIWVKKEDYFDGYLEKYKSRAKCASNDKEVLQYDFMGNYINSYISCSEAGRALGRKTVNTAARGRDPQAYGYIWIYKQDYTEDLLKEKLERVKQCKSYSKIIDNLNKLNEQNL